MPVMARLNHFSFAVFQPARFSDKSLWLTYEKQDVWISRRQGHGTEAAHEDDPQYNVDFVTLDVPLTSGQLRSSPATNEELPD